MNEDVPDSPGLVVFAVTEGIGSLNLDATQAENVLEHQPPAVPDTGSLKSMESKNPSASLKIDVDELESIISHVYFSPKKEPADSHSSDLSFDSTTVTPLARVVPLITRVDLLSQSSPPRSAPLSKQNSDIGMQSPDMAHLPSIRHRAQSSRFTPTRTTTATTALEGKHRSKSMIGKLSPAGVSFSPYETPPAPLLFNLDAKLTPSEKFRSFFKSLAPQRSTINQEFSQNAEGEITGSVKLPAGSVKMAISESDKALQARIAKVQGEQARYRRTQKLKNTVMGGYNRSWDDSSENSSSKATAIKTNILKVDKNGAAQNFNANSIRAGLTRQEFRDTLEVGNLIVKHNNVSKEHASEGEGGVTSEDQVASDAPAVVVPAAVPASEAPPPFKESSVTRSGPGYMTEDDWKVTLKENGRLLAKRRLRSLNSSRDFQEDGTSDSYTGTNSNLNLEQFVDSELKGQSQKNRDMADAPGTRDVPLCYLQSAHLIDRRFGWDTKDHSLVNIEAETVKNWTKLKAVVHTTGVLHSLAASPAPMTEISAAQRIKNMDPKPNAPYIVQEATPVTELVASLLHRHSLDATSSDSFDRASTPERARAQHFSILKEIPQRMSHDRSSSPLGPKLRALSKEEEKSIHIKANTREFHDRYNGLIFRDSSRDLTWHDTEDMILGTVKPRKNDLLLHRGDMRWAGKTLNMFRPWSAARESDVIDQFRLKRSETAKSNALSLSKPGSPGHASMTTPPDSPGSSTRSSPQKPGSPYSSLVPIDESSVSSADRFFAGHGSSPSKASRSRSPPKNGNRAGGGASVSGSLSGSVYSAGSTHGGSLSGSVGSSVPASVSFALHHPHSHPHGQVHSHGHGPTHGPTHGHGYHLDDNASAFTMNSNMHGSRSSTSKRPPLLINVVKPLPPLQHSY